MCVFVCVWGGGSSVLIPVILPKCLFNTILTGDDTCAGSGLSSCCVMSYDGKDCVTRECVCLAKSATCFCDKDCQKHDVCCSDFDATQCK